MSVCSQPLSHIGASVDVTEARQLIVTAPSSSAAVLKSGNSRHIQNIMRICLIRHLRRCWRSVCIYKIARASLEDCLERGESECLMLPSRRLEAINCQMHRHQCGLKAASNPLRMYAGSSNGIGNGNSNTGTNNGNSAGNSNVSSFLPDLTRPPLHHSLKCHGSKSLLRASRLGNATPAGG